MRRQFWKQSWKVKPITLPETLGHASGAEVLPGVRNTYQAVTEGLNPRWSAGHGTLY